MVDRQETFLSDPSRASTCAILSRTHKNSAPYSLLLKWDLHTQLRMREGMKSEEWNKTVPCQNDARPFSSSSSSSYSLSFLTLYRLKVHTEIILEGRSKDFFSLRFKDIGFNTFTINFLKLKTIEKKKTLKFSTRVKNVIR